PDIMGASLNPWVFHTANVFVHLLAVLVAFAILRRLLRRVAAEAAAEWGAFFGAAVFATHPVQVEPVAWVSGLKDVLCGLLVLVSLWQYLLWAESNSGTHADDSATTYGTPTALHYVLATAAFVIALL